MINTVNDVCSTLSEYCEKVGESRVIIRLPNVWEKKLSMPLQNIKCFFDTEDEIHIIGLVDFEKSWWRIFKVKTT